MKRWKIRTLVILALGVAGMAALAYRPALVGDVVRYETDMPLGIVLREQNMESRADMEEEYRWSFKRSPSHTVFLHQNAQDAFSLLQGEPVWVLRFKARNGTAVVEGNLPQMQLDGVLGQVQAHFLVYPSGFATLRLPNGRQQFQRMFTLMCELTVTPCLWGEPAHSIAVQQVMVDFYDDAMDLVEPEQARILAGGMRRVDVVSAVPSGLPERFCGNTCERELTRYLYSVASIYNQGTAALALPALQRQGRELVDTFADAEKPWPDCWGDAADTARLNAQKIIPLLQTFKEQNAYGSKELEEFLNGPVFQRIFGENLLDIQAEPQVKQAEEKEKA